MAERGIKCVVVGDSNNSNNKTALLITYVTGEYPRDYIPTVFDNYSINVTCDGWNVNLGLWDTAGQEDYARLRPWTYPMTDVFMLVFSVISPSSFENVTAMWIPELRNHAPSTPIVLVGCNVEHRDDPVILAALSEKGKAPITSQQGEHLAQQINAYTYVEVKMTSSLHSVNMAFDEAIRAVRSVRSGGVLPLHMRKSSLFGPKWEQRYFVRNGEKLHHSSKPSNLTLRKSTTFSPYKAPKSINLDGATFSEIRSEGSGSSTMHVFSITARDSSVLELASSSLSDAQAAFKAFGGRMTAAVVQEAIAAPANVPTTTLSSEVSATPDGALDPTAVTCTEDELFEAAYQAALQSAGRPFAFSQLCLVGEGRAGKTALARSLCGRPFVQTDSTIGVGLERMEVDRVDVRVDSSAGKWSVMQPDKQPDSFVEEQMAWEAAGVLRGDRGDGGNGSFTDLFSSLEVDVAEASASSSSTQSQHSHASSSPAAATGNAAVASVSSSPVAAAAPPSGGIAPDSPSTTPRSTSGGSSMAAAAAATPVTRLNKQMVLDRSKGKQPLRVNLLDFSGQEVFYSLHHLYLTRYCVYLVVFNMEWLSPSAPEATKQQCVKFLSFWLNSIFHHARAPPGYKSGRIAPIILVGTHKDKISSPADHEAMSNLLRDKFWSSPVWSSVQAFKEGTVTAGRGLLWFYPTMCGDGLVDPVIEKIKAQVQQKLEEEEYLKCKIALPWLQTLDVIQSKHLPFMMLQDVETVARRCGLPVTHLTLEEEVIRMLKYFTQQGLLMHHNRPSLRHLVVLDTMQCLVSPASVVMCQHDIHLLPVLEDARRFNGGHEYRLLIKGELDTLLLPILWPEHSRITKEIEQLMVLYGLMVPLLKQEQDADAAMLYRYLVPTLLPKLRNSDPQPVHCHCYFVFGMAEQVQEWTKVGHFMGRDASSLGFCPNGLFARLTGKIVSECQCTYQNYDCAKGYYETCAAFGRHVFTVRELPELNMIQLLVKVQNPRFLTDELERLVGQVVAEMIPNLSFAIAVLADGSTGPNFHSHCVSSERLLVLNGDRGLIKLVSDDQPLPVGESMPLSASDARKRFEPWLPPIGLRSDGYDVFLSYRWTGSFEDDLTTGIFNALSCGEHGVLGSSGREIRVFLDKQRLQDGRNFQEDFAEALLKTHVPVTIVSTAALARMRSLKPDSAVDNLLLEWTLIVELMDRDTKILSECLPVFVGTFDCTASSCASMITSLFRDNVIDSLPDVTVASIIAKVRAILQRHGIPESSHLDQRTVRGVVKKLELQMAVQSWKLLEEPRLARVPASHVQEEVTRTVVTHCAKKIRHMLEQRVAEAAAVCQQQQQQHADTREDIMQRLVDVLARAGVVPVEKRAQFAQAMYENGISNEQKLRDSVLGDRPVIDLAADIGMNRVQAKDMRDYLAS